MNDVRMRSSSRLPTSARAAVRGGGRGRGVEPSLEQLDDEMGNGAVRIERLREIALAERRARLTEILRVGAQDDDLLGRELGREHERVEAVFFDLTLENRPQGAQELPADLFVTERVAVAARSKPEVGEPNNGALGGAQLERTLVDHRHAEVLEHR